MVHRERTLIMSAGSTKYTMRSSRITPWKTILVYLCGIVPACVQGTDEILEVATCAGTGVKLDEVVCTGPDDVIGYVEAYYGEPLGFATSCHDAIQRPFEHCFENIDDTKHKEYHDEIQNKCLWKKQCEDLPVRRSRHTHCTNLLYTEYVVIWYICHSAESTTESYITVSNSNDVGTSEHGQITTYSTNTATSWTFHNESATNVILDGDPDEEETGVFTTDMIIITSVVVVVFAVIFVILVVCCVRRWRKDQIYRRAVHTVMALRQYRHTTGAEGMIISQLDNNETLNSTTGNNPSFMDPALTVNQQDAGAHQPAASAALEMPMYEDPEVYKHPDMDHKMAEPTRYDSGGAEDHVAYTGDVEYSTVGSHGFHNPCAGNGPTGSTFTSQLSAGDTSVFDNLTYASHDQYSETSRDTSLVTQLSIDGTNVMDNNMYESQVEIDETITNRSYGSQQPTERNCINKRRPSRPSLTKMARVDEYGNFQ